MKYKKLQAHLDVANKILLNHSTCDAIELQKKLVDEFEKEGNEISKCMDKYGFNSDLSVAQELYNTLIEIPTTYAAYGFGQCYFMDLHNEAKEALGGYYDEIEFNSVIHSRGWCSLGTLEKVVDEYIEQTVLKYTIIEA